ncbi:hypothetical protein BKA65DRAFT_479977 [Rhexocercosporidium sp. MPI-PUGE-AT-0058]|nr:hypothetical protein BKA65DRAFT_479977 [Rhexocercosporidium sp. MPI-PUGE-AT-0058]
MSTLSEVIRNVTSMVDNAELEAKLEWPLSELRSCDKVCSRLSLAEWQLGLERVYGNQVLHDGRFWEIQGKIDECLKSVSRKTHTLRLWTQKRGSPDPSVVSYRHLVILALKDVLEAFEHFCILGGNPTGIVFAYIEKCYGFMISLGQLMYPYEDGETWFTGHTEYLDGGLNNFLLDGGKNIWQVPENPTLAAQILDDTAMPASCLPNWPEPPLVVRTRGPYGPALSENVYNKQQ